MSDPITLTFHHDPGHGWLAVPSDIYAKLGRPALTRYSYLATDGTRYAEEDCDAAVIIDAAKAKGLALKIVEQGHDNDCFIRNITRRCA